MLSEADILTALRDCFDPEVKLNLVDLGLIYEVATGPDPDSTPAWPRQWVKVTMTLTTPQCPACGLIFEQVNNRLAGIPDISEVEVEPGVGAQMDAPLHQRGRAQAVGNLGSLPETRNRKHVAKHDDR